MRKYFVAAIVIASLSVVVIAANILNKTLSFHQILKNGDTPTLDYEKEITREKSDARQAKDRRFKGLGNPGKGPIFELPLGVEPLPSNVHWWIGLSALPVDQSDVVILGKVVESSAHLTGDRTGIYSEFLLEVEQVFKVPSSITSTGSLVANRIGGNVRFASGRVQKYSIRRQGMPQKGGRYVLFLRKSPEGDLIILTGYELKGGRVIPLDGEDIQNEKSNLPFAQYRDTEESLFFEKLHVVTANSEMSFNR